MRILVTGSRGARNRTLFDSVFCAAVSLADPLYAPPQWGTESNTLVVGDALGVDRMAAEWWSEPGRFTVAHQVELFKADWDSFGRKAGPIRNQQMVDSGADVCLAFTVEGRPFTGTLDCVKRAMSAGIPTHIYRLGE